MPPDVRKGCAFPTTSALVWAMPVYNLTAGIAPKNRIGTERHSLSAHQAAQPQREQEVGSIILIPVLHTYFGKYARAQWHTYFVRVSAFP